MIEGQLGTYNGEIDRLVRGKRTQGIDIRNIDGREIRHAGDSRVSRRTQNAGHPSLTGEFPRNGVLAASPADDQDIHEVWI